METAKVVNMSEHLGSKDPITEVCHLYNILSRTIERLEEISLCVSSVERFKYGDRTIDYAEALTIAQEHMRKIIRDVRWKNITTKQGEANA